MRSKVEKPANCTDSFPILAQGRARADDFIVLFTSAYCGTVVYDPNDIHGIGHYASSWVSVYSEEHWDILPHGTTVSLTVDSDDNGYD